MIGLDKTSRAIFSTDARALRIDRLVERNLKILALPHIFDAGKPEQFDGMLDCFALRIEHAGFQVYVDFGFHLWPIPGGIKHCLKSVFTPNISGSCLRHKNAPKKKIIMQNPPPVQTAPK